MELKEQSEVFWVRWKKGTMASLAVQDWCKSRLWPRFPWVQNGAVPAVAFQWGRISFPYTGWGCPKVLGPPKPAPEKNFPSQEQSWLEAELSLVTSAGAELGSCGKHSTGCWLLTGQKCCGCALWSPLCGTFLY